MYLIWFVGTKTALESKGLKEKLAFGGPVLNQLINKLKPGSEKTGDVAVHHVAKPSMSNYIHRIPLQYPYIII